MHEMLKEAYTRGLEASIRRESPNDVEFLKEAFDWRRALSVFNPIATAARAAAAVPLAAGGRWARRMVSPLAQQAAGGGVARSMLAQQALLSGAGAGIGALTAGEGQRGRGAAIGALGGLGLGLGARMGGLKSMGKSIATIAGSGARKIHTGTLARGDLGKYIAKQMTSSPWKHQIARQALGAGVVGGAGALGATALASKLIPQQQAQQGYQMSGPYGQALGLTPAAYQEYPYQQYQGGPYGQGGV